ncbi:hypothetical protein M426DRAFT_25364 [Hypoxylon sp. CI-4A]|nr:hypothetical protein M426DRAFT_25364 [Hypoxylon sp. CI-4A]
MAPAKDKYCDDCDFGPALNHNLLEHEKYNHIGTICKKCRMPTTSSAGLKDHIHKAHPPHTVGSRFSCAWCGKIVDNETSAFRCYIYHFFPGKEWASITPASEDECNLLKNFDLNAAQEHQVYGELRVIDSLLQSMNTRIDQLEATPPIGEATPTEWKKMRKMCATIWRRLNEMDGGDVEENPVIASRQKRLRTTDRRISHTIYSGALGSSRGPEIPAPAQDTQQQPPQGQDGTRKRARKPRKSRQNLEAPSQSQTSTGGLPPQQQNVGNQDYTQGSHVGDQGFRGNHSTSLYSPMPMGGSQLHQQQQQQQHHMQGRGSAAAQTHVGGQGLLEQQVTQQASTSFMSPNPIQSQGTMQYQNLGAFSLSSHHAPAPTSQSSPSQSLQVQNENHGQEHFQGLWNFTDDSSLAQPATTTNAQQNPMLDQSAYPPFED